MEIFTFYGTNESQHNPNNSFPYFDNSVNNSTKHQDGTDNIKENPAESTEPQAQSNLEDLEQNNIEDNKSGKMLDNETIDHNDNQAESYSDNCTSDEITVIEEHNHEFELDIHFNSSNDSNDKTHENTTGCDTENDQNHIQHQSDQNNFVNVIEQQQDSSDVTIESKTTHHDIYGSVSATESTEQTILDPMKEDENKNLYELETETEKSLNIYDQAYETMNSTTVEHSIETTEATTLSTT